VEDIERRLLGTEEPPQITTQDVVEPTPDVVVEPTPDVVRETPVNLLPAHLNDMTAELLGMGHVGLNDATRAYALFLHLGGGVSGTMEREQISEREVYYSFKVGDFSCESVSPYASDRVFRGGPYHTEYLVLTDEEADSDCDNYLRGEGIAWCNPAFLEGCTGIPEEVFVTLQNEGKSSVITETIYATGRLDVAIEEVIRTDGRGALLADYDHEEHEVRIGPHTLYIYRVD
jgi:hypothetical protein